MIRKSVLFFVAMVFGLALLTACGLLSPDASFAATHPQELGAGRPICTTCHSDEALKGAVKPYADFNHTASFVKDHRFAANRDLNVCASCHAPSFCADCHTGKTMMTPSTKLSDRPDRAMPHRSNYLTLHRMDGKMDPTSCYKCHGKANNDKCMTCHK